MDNFQCACIQRINLKIDVERRQKNLIGPCYNGTYYFMLKILTDDGRYDDDKVKNIPRLFEVVLSCSDQFEHGFCCEYSSEN